MERSFKRPYNEQQLIGKIYSSQKTSSIKRGHPMPDYTLEEFIEWVYKQSNFKKLFKDWKESGQKSLLVPSADRLDDSKPYTLDNIQLVTWTENMANARKIYKMIISKYSLDGEFIKVYKDATEASIDINGNSQCISRAARGIKRQAHNYLWFVGTDIPEKIVKEKVQIYREHVRDKPILQFNTNGLLLNRFNTVREAAEILSLNHSNIMAAAMKVNYTAGAGYDERFIFIYEDMFTEDLLKEKILSHIEKAIIGTIDGKRFIFDNAESASRIMSKMLDVTISSVKLRKKLRDPNNKEWFYLTDLKYDKIKELRNDIPRVFKP